MSDFPLALNSIEDQTTAQTIVQIFLSQSIDEKGIKKEPITKFFDSLLNNLENKGVSPKTKFYSIFILKQISIKQKINSKIFGPFSIHPLYLYLQDLAFNIDPKKNLSQKGKTLFPSDKNTGNQLMRLILESFVSWGMKFPTNSKKQPTKFKKTLNRLNEEKIVLPKQFIYYTLPSNKGIQSKGIKTNKEIKTQISSNATPNPSKSIEPKQKYMIELKYMQNKIQELFGIIQDCEEQEIRKQVLSFHNKFQKDREKLQQYETFIFQLNSEQIVNKYLNVNSFLQEQQILYNKFILKDDYNSYISAYQMNFEKEFQNSVVKKPQPNKNQISIDNNIEKSKISVPPQPKITEQKIISSQNLKIQSKSASNKIEENQINLKEKKISEIGKENRNVSQSYFAKLSRAPKVAPQGFNCITKSLQKSKINSVAPRLKSSNLNVSNLKGAKNFTNTSALNKSNFNLKGIFANPPNPNVANKNFDGQLIIENMQLQRQCSNVSKKQGSRRFKASLFKNKYITYEDDFIQIGFKSSAIYEKIQKFTSFIDFELFFGNKTNHNITKFNILFEGDKKSLIYTNPQRIQHIINPQQQIKMQLLNVPKTMPFGFINLSGSYQILGDNFHFVALLPTSILQMTTYNDVDSSLIDKKWRQCSHILKTQPFKLSRYFPPDQILHFLPKVKENIPYSIFSEEGSTTDYELFCQIHIQQKYKAILKINIRPDLNVILQLGIYVNEQNAINCFKFYLQSLMTGLKQFQI